MGDIRRRRRADLPGWSAKTAAAYALLSPNLFSPMGLKSSKTATNGSYDESAERASLAGTPILRPQQGPHRSTNFKRRLKKGIRLVKRTRPALPSTTTTVFETYQNNVEGVGENVGLRAPRAWSLKPHNRGGSHSISDGHAPGHPAADLRYRFADVTSSSAAAGSRSTAPAVAGLPICPLTSDGVRCARITTGNRDDQSKRPGRIISDRRLTVAIANSAARYSATNVLAW